MVRNSSWDRHALGIALAVVLAGCSSDQIDKFYWLPTKAEREAADSAKCVELGFKPGTEGHGNCRLQLEQIRATKQATNAADASAAAVRRASAQSESSTTSYIDAHSGRLVTCSGSGAAKTCF